VPVEGVPGITSSQQFVYYAYDLGHTARCVRQRGVLCIGVRIGVVGLVVGVLCVVGHVCWRVIFFPIEISFKWVRVESEVVPLHELVHRSGGLSR